MFLKALKHIALGLGLTYLVLLVFDFAYVRLTGQTPLQSLTLVLYSNITSASTLDGCFANYPCIDNRSQWIRQSSLSSFRAVGTGTWSVTMQYADVAPSIWVSFGSTGVVSNTGPASGIGYGIGPAVLAKPYHDYIRFVITGNATILNYNGTRQFWWLPSVASIAFPITAGQGGTGSSTMFVGVYSAADAASWSAAVSALSAGNVLVVPTGYQTTAATGATLSANNVTIYCQPGASVTVSANVVPLTVSGSGDQVQGPCVFDGQYSQSGYSSNGISLSHAVNFVINGVTVQNVGGVGIGCLATGGTAISGKILNSIFTGDISSSIYIQCSAKNVEIAGNSIDDTSLGSMSNVTPIAVHQTSTMNSVNAVDIHDNFTNHGTEAFCEEYQGAANFATGQQGVKSHSNHCRLNANAFGMVSMVSSSNGTIENDTLDHNGYSSTIAFIEMGGGGQIIANNNLEYGSGSANLYGASLNSCTPDCRFSNNTVQGLVQETQVSTTPDTGMQILGNNITLQSGAGGLSGIIIFPNATGSSISDTLVSGNIVTGNGYSGATPVAGLTLEDFANTQTLDRVTFSGNTVRGFPYCFLGSQYATNAKAINNDCGTVPQNNLSFGALTSIGFIEVCNLNLPCVTTGSLPVCTNGTGADGVGTAPCAAIVGSLPNLQVKIVSGGTPATAPAYLFTLTNFPLGYFSTSPASCIVQSTAGGDGIIPVYMGIDSTQSTVKIDNTVTAGGSGFTYYVAVYCPAN